MPGAQAQWPYYIMVKIFARNSTTGLPEPPPYLPKNKGTMQMQARRQSALQCPAT